MSIAALSAILGLTILVVALTVEDLNHRGGAPTRIP
jgi:hypothetical protein